MSTLSDAEIVAIRDEHLPNQGERFDCIAFARAILAAAEAPAGLRECSKCGYKEECCPIADCPLDAPSKGST